MVGIVHLLHEIGDRKLQLMGPESAGLARGRKCVPAAEIHEDVGGLGDYQLARPQEGRRKRQLANAAALHESHHAGHAATPALTTARDVDIVGARLFEGEPNEFPTTLDRWPVVEFVAHGSALHDGAGDPSARRRSRPILR